MEIQLAAENNRILFKLLQNNSRISRKFYRKICSGIIFSHAGLFMVSKLLTVLLKVKMFFASYGKTF